MNDFDKMVKHYLLPPFVETYLISNNGIVELNGYVINQENGNKEHLHPEFEKFNWAIEHSQEIVNLHNTLLNQTNDGKKSVIAIFEDKTFKTILNVDKEYKPTLSLKTL